MKLGRCIKHHLPWFNLETAMIYSCGAGCKMTHYEAMTFPNGNKGIDLQSNNDTSGETK